MKTKNSGAGAGAMFKKRRAPKPKLCYFYDGSAAMKKVADTWLNQSHHHYMLLHMSSPIDK